MQLELFVVLKSVFSLVLISAADVSSCNNPSCQCGDTCTCGSQCPCGSTTTKTSPYASNRSSVGIGGFDPFFGGFQSGGLWGQSQCMHTHQHNDVKHGVHDRIQV